MNVECVTDDFLITINYFILFLYDLFYQSVGSQAVLAFKTIIIKDISEFQANDPVKF